MIRLVLRIAWFEARTSVLVTLTLVLAAVGTGLALGLARLSPAAPVGIVLPTAERPAEPLPDWAPALRRARWFDDRGAATEALGRGEVGVVMAPAPDLRTWDRIERAGWFVDATDAEEDALHELRWLRAATDGRVPAGTVAAAFAREPDDRPTRAGLVRFGLAITLGSASLYSATEAFQRRARALRTAALLLSAVPPGPLVAGRSLAVALGPLHWPRRVGALAALAVLLPVALRDLGVGEVTVAVGFAALATATQHAAIAFVPHEGAPVRGLAWGAAPPVVAIAAAVGGERIASSLTWFPPTTAAALAGRAIVGDVVAREVATGAVLSVAAWAAVVALAASRSRLEPPRSLLDRALARVWPR